MNVSLIIPAYNEEKRLRPFLESIKTQLQKTPTLLYEIVVVDDGSRDHTKAVAESYQNDISILKVMSHPQNQGKGAAVRTGVLSATGDYIIFMDADGATDASEIPRLLEHLKTADIVIGNRFLPGAKTDRHSALRTLSGYTNRVYMRLFGLGDIDVMCGFKGYTKAAARDLFGNLMENRWLFDTEIAYKAVRKKYRIINLPITWESKDGSKLPTRTLIKSAFQILPLILRVNKQLKAV